MKIAFIGTGVMGHSMAGHLMEAGHELVVFTRTRSKANSLLERGARWAKTPAEAADGADMAIAIVGMPHDVEEVFLGEAGILSADTPPPIIIDMTTSPPSLARRIAEAASARGLSAIDAPVSGGDVGARNGTLSIMVGGETPAVATAMPIFELMGKTIVHQGPAGSGQHTKMVNQILIAGGMLGMCEGLRYAQMAGLDGAKVIESVGGGAAGSWSINNLGPRILERDFEPGFFIEHFLKDLTIAFEEAASMGLELKALSMAREFYELAVNDGLGRKGTQALQLLVERDPATSS
ncbi:MAG: NAD(P)-dependent oxidoreductase [Phycisphaerales bacterium]|nr:NAD(P)-dependent oxidoreductase [Phycisphaerales bacterium]